MLFKSLSIAMKEKACQTYEMMRHWLEKCHAHMRWWNRFM